MNVKKYHVGLFVVVVLVFFLLFNHRFEFIISLENYKNQPEISIEKPQPREPDLPIPINFSKPFENTQWLIIENLYFYKCLEVAETLPLWTVMCITEKSSRNKREKNLITMNMKAANDIRRTLNISKLSIENLYHAFAVKLGATVIYKLREGSLSKDMTHRLQTLSSRNFFRLRKIKGAFNSSLYYGCHSTQKPDVQEKQLRQPLYCEGNHIAGISTPALLSPLQDTTNCDKTMPDISIFHETYVPIRFSASIFNQCAFYFLPLTNDTLMTSPLSKDYSCLVQHFLKKTGCGVSVHWDAGIKSTNKSDSFHEFCTERLKKFPSCAADNAVHCLLRTLNSSFDDQIKKVLLDWMDVLTSLQFTPLFKNSTNISCSGTIWYPMLSSANGAIENIKTIEDTYNKTCFGNKINDSIKVDLSKPWFQKPNIILLVTFNRLYVDVLPLVEMQYRPFYPHIIYCADRLPRLEEVLPFRLRFITYVQKHHPGSLNYACYLKVMRMGLKIEGILATADDVFLKTDLARFPLNRLWYRSEDVYKLKDMDTMKDCHMNGVCDFFVEWMWWELFKKNIFNFFTEIDKTEDSDLKAMRKQLISVAKGKHRMFGSVSDTFFIPKIYFSNFTKIVSLLLKTEVFLEIAIPTALRSMERIENIHTMNIKYLWTSDRMRPWTFMKKRLLENYVGVHPVKLRGVVENFPQALDMFCRCIIPYFHDPNQVFCF